jgi:hypothetical protein
MAYADYGALKAALSTTLFHQRFVADYDNATVQFEASANRRLRVRQMEASASLTTINGEVALPTDYLLWRTVLPAAYPGDDELDYVHPAYLEQAGDRKVFTIEGTKFKARPIDDTTDAYEFHYYQKIPTLTTSDTTSNWLLAAYPDLYKFGVLVELFGLGRNVDGAQLYKARRDEVLAEIIQLSALTTGASSPAARASEYF